MVTAPRYEEHATCPAPDCGAEFWWAYEDAEDCGAAGWSIECPECGREFDPEMSR